MFNFLKCGSYDEWRAQLALCAGESYAGHYVPAVASRVFLANAGKELFRPINLKGLAIGNGLTVPRVQVSAWEDFKGPQLSNEFDS